VKQGSPVIATLTLKNTSKERAQVRETIDEWDYEFIVTDATGKQVDLTAYGSKLSEAERSGHAILRSMEPGAEIRKDFDLSRIFVLDVPGRYYVRAIRAVLPATGTTAEKAVSDAIEFAVFR